MVICLNFKVKIKRQRNMQNGRIKWAMYRLVAPYLSGASVHIIQSANRLLWDSNGLYLICFQMSLVYIDKF